MAVSEIVRIFASENEMICGMKEKGHPLIEEGQDMAAEPAVALDYSFVDIADDTDYELRGHDFGLPHTILELKAELEEAESEMDDPDKWCSSEQVWADIRQTFPWANIR